MSESTIGIKIANGEYYPVLQGGDLVRKKLVLTTVNDNQESVQIDLYKGFGSSIENASYIGSLIIEDIAPKISGEPDIELVLGVDDEGNLNATASDRQSGDMQSLSVSLDSIAEPESYDLPDFELNEESEDEFSAGEDLFGDVPSPDFSSSSQEWDVPDSGVTPEEETILTGSRKGTRKVRPLLLGAFIVAGLVIIGLLIILLLRSFPGEDTPPLEAEAGQTRAVAVDAGEAADRTPAETAEETSVKNTEETPVKTPAVSENTEAAGQAAEPPAEETVETGGNGFWYEIKYGDTLWDLSNAFYRTPWLYGRLAAENNIEDPDLIYWGNQLYIPE